MVIIALELVGISRAARQSKIYPLIYEARGSDQTLMLTSILDAMDKAGERLSNVERDAIGELQRVTFALIATKKQHERLQAGCAPSRPSTRCSPSAIRRKIEDRDQR